MTKSQNFVIFCVIIVPDYTFSAYFVIEILKNYNN